MLQQPYQKLEDGADPVTSNKIQEDGSGKQDTAAAGGTKKKVRSVLFVVIAWIMLYQVAASFNLVAVKFMNYKLHFQFLLFIALLQKSGFIFSSILAIAMMVFRGYKLKKLSNKLLLTFVVLGMLGAFTAYATSVGLNTLSGSTYALLKTSDLVFNVILCKLILKKKFTQFHYYSVLLILSGVALNVIDALRNPPEHKASKTGDTPSVTTGALATLGGAFLDALTSVVSDKLLKKEKAANIDPSRQHSPFFLVLVFSSFASVFSFLFLLIPLFATKEEALYPDSFNWMESEGWYGNGFSSIKNWVFILVCLGVSSSRFLVRLARYYIVMVRSAFTFAVVKPLRRVITIGFVVLLFSESFSAFKGLGMMLSVIGFGSYVIGSRRLSKQKKEKLEEYITPLQVPSVTDFVERLREPSGKDAKDKNAAFWSVPDKKSASRPIAISEASEGGYSPGGGYATTNLDGWYRTLTDELDEAYDDPYLSGVHNSL